jgi:hypothetical protein
MEFSSSKRKFSEINNEEEFDEEIDIGTEEFDTEAACLAQVHSGHALRGDDQLNLDSKIFLSIVMNKGKYVEEVFVCF